MYTVYRTYTEGELRYFGHDLELAIRAWDSATYDAGRTVPGGVSVATYTDDPTPLQVRDGWILHVMEDGTVYLHPRVAEEITV